ncbi:hypothetical protein IJG93_01710 [Candidatus Saccharibacteria bacterium]|nr:hypothetical protein [Candidatus Saccharibacteria bacterium]
MKKLVSLFLSAIILATMFGIPVYAYTFPADSKNWSDKDWKKWNEYWEKYWEKHDDDWVELYYDNEHRIVWDEEKWRKHEEEWRKEKEKKRKKAEKEWKEYEEKMRKYEEDMQRYNEDMRRYYGNSTTPNYGYNNYSGYNFYGGVINAYDAATENQAVILAKIIYLYGHGVSSVTSQACVGWTVMNSIDASGGGVDIGTIAPNFHYDASLPTTDDFGRDLLPLARDIILRWKAGRAGIANNGRVLPSGYLYATSTGSAVTFTTAPNGGSIWNYSYTTPYGS